MFFVFEKFYLIFGVQKKKKKKKKKKKLKKEEESRRYCFLRRTRI